MSDFENILASDYALEKQIGHLLRRAYQRHTAIFQKEIPDIDLTSVQFAVMTAIRKLGNAPIVQISHETAVDHATLRDVVSRLKKRGLVQIVQDKADRRQRLVSITPEGKALIDATIPVAKKVTELTLAPLDACERIAALHILGKLAISES
ncbi:MarR family winged helix-turn-helix transcriptional regulator [Acetobacter suratthaniensis]|uniref:Winged helix-turn-helix transcriptional regulator n=1 Tax=Acetobacter suratthaniensis TaxID=1502841 RepID=A0ABS3LP55_9PROT|nr:MarR family winged helix-turn-helix transcriptional regulator [Acetobacter suratthaniensis]MBO1329150.1 winged helix-turn-helix transcriptional regulator [Acetobacter suratthaniensis]MCX2567152.1 MarR family winged helix-turn-helix transcriptional regulator [Acetobacter suratthaniensis]